MKITSLNNDLIKETAKLLQKKYRDESGLFLIEGAKGVKEAQEFNIPLEKIFWSGKFPDYILDKSLLIEVSDAVLGKISDAKTPPPIVAIAKQPNFKFEDLNSMNKVVLLEDIKDSGNLGTIIRTSVAFGVDAIILYGETVDLYNPKTVRSTVGNLWKTKIYSIKDFDILQKYFKNFERIATLPKSDDTQYLGSYQINKPALIMFGSESSGLSENLKSFAVQNITIEMKKDVESLNLAISAGIILYKLFVK